MDRQRIVNDFVSAQGATIANDPRSAGIEELDRLAHAEPEAAWALILEILAHAPSQDALALLAAGPLEDLIEYHGPSFIDRIELCARRDPKFRYLLGGVWQSSTPEVWSRVEAARVSAW